MTVEKYAIYLYTPRNSFLFLSTSYSLIWPSNGSGGSFNLCNFAVEELLNCSKSIFYEAIANENINAIHGPTQEHVYGLKV